MLALISLYYLCRKQFNRQTALLAALLFALSPYAVFYAQEARMYSLLMFLGVWSFFFTYRWILYQWKWDLLGIALFSLAFLYSHGAGFIWLVSLDSFAVLFGLTGGSKEKKAVLQLALLELLVIALYIPWLVRAVQVTHIDHTSLPSLQDAASTVFTLLFGAFQRPLSWKMWASELLVLAGITITSLRNPAIRILAVSFLLVPLAFAGAVQQLPVGGVAQQLRQHILYVIEIIDGLEQRADADFAEPFVPGPTCQAGQPGEEHDFQDVACGVGHGDDVVAEGVFADLLLHAVHDIEDLQGLPGLVGERVALQRRRC